MVVGGGGGGGGGGGTKENQRHMSLVLRIIMHAYTARVVWYQLLHYRLPF